MLKRHIIYLSNSYHYSNSFGVFFLQKKDKFVHLILMGHQNQGINENQRSFIQTLVIKRTEYITAEMLLQKFKSSSIENYYNVGDKKKNHKITINKLYYNYSTKFMWKKKWLLKATNRKPLTSQTSLTSHLDKVLNRPPVAGMSSKKGSSSGSLSNSSLPRITFCLAPSLFWESEWELLDFVAATFFGCCSCCW